jgi:hypothetical protein
MTDITWMKQRVPCSVILGVEDDSELEPMSGGGGEPKRSELSELAADLTWKLCKETTVSREELPDGAMVEIVRQLLK